MAKKEVDRLIAPVEAEIGIEAGSTIEELACALGLALPGQ
jgi:hypothetical protein